MQANAEKFQAIAIDNKTHITKYSSNLNGKNKKCDNNVTTTRSNNRFHQFLQLFIRPIKITIT
jgi:hypothetical protein